MELFDKSTDAFAALKIREFSYFLMFRFFVTIATLMQSVIVGWQMYELTHDPLDLGFIGLAEAIPAICIALFAGHIADKYDRKTIILISLIVFVVGALMLLACSIEQLGLIKRFGIWPIFIIVGLGGFSRGFIYPSAMGLMAQVVPRALYANSATWNSVLWHIGAVTGPAIGGLVYGFKGVQAAYIGVLGFAVFAVFMLIPIRKKPIMVSEKVETMKDRLLSGLRFVFSNQVMLGAMSLDMFAVLFGGAVAMLPVFANDILHVGPQGLGVLRAAPAIGSISMSLFLAYHPPLQKAGKSLLIGVTGFGVSILLFAISTNFYLSIVLLMLSGMFDNISVVIRQTILQLLTPDEVRGRVAAVNSIFIGSSNEIGSFESGLAASLMGLVPSVLFGGAMTLLVVSVTAAVAPVLRRLNLTNYK
ncbi:MAG: MFS transporter [Bacteroidota bacterium]|nr:MFS transporter [Bacteroidota bacterium]